MLKNVTWQTLDHAVDFDSPFRVYENGVIETCIGQHAPDLFNGELETGSGWDFIDGYSGQDRYAGPIMHDSEYLGGQMARDVLANPGIYCLVPAYYDDEDNAGETFIEGWALLIKDETES